MAYTPIGQRSTIDTDSLNNKRGDNMPNTTISEYQEKNLKAIVQHRPGRNDYVVIGYIDGLERNMFVFDSEWAAEDCAEDWVQGVTNFEPNEDSTILELQDDLDLDK